MRKKNTIKKNVALNEQQIKFCESYAYGPNRGNGVISYMEAYELDMSQPGSYSGARASASKLLTNTNILTYIRELYESTDLNDTVVDNELAFVIKQNADFGSKVAAIKEYNALKQRVKNKLELGADKSFLDFLKQTSG